MAPKTQEHLETSHHERRRDRRLSDPAFKEAYERSREEIRQIDEVIRSLDRLREEAGMSKADLARLIGKEPAAVRRLFSASKNPELKTVAAIATALKARVEIVPMEEPKGAKTVR